MSQPSRKPGLVRRSPYAVGELVTDPAELARLDADRGPEDGGVERMVGAALEIAGDREARGKPVDLSGAALALLQTLTPEQQLEFVRGLPAALNDAARRELALRLHPTTESLQGP